MSEKARIVIADDDTENAKTIEEALKQDGYNARLCSDGEAALRLVQAWMPHIVLLDINMPKLSGLECLEKIRALNSEEYITVILVTANAELPDIIRGLDLGANDYIIKPYRILELKARVRAGLRVKNVYDSLRRANKQLEELSTLDELSGLRNMRYTLKRIDDEVQRAIEQKLPLSCIMFDMDHFKKVNDNHDHLFGSFVLSQVGKVVRESLRPTDVGARYGGDEYFILLPKTTIQEAQSFAEQLRKNIEAHHFSADIHSIKTTASFGVAGLKNIHEAARLTSHELLRTVDAALYAAKHAGRNRVEVLSVGEFKPNRL